VTVPLCRAADLTGAFTLVPGSAGAGNVVYRLQLTKRTPGRCFVTGLPRVRLLGRRGKPLPTRVFAAHPARLTAARAILQRGASTTAQARFSPDVPGRGEQFRGRCEPRAYRLRVSPGGGGSLAVPIRPPTPVCEHGRLALDAYAIR
jgi:hypothetical protein